MTDLYDFPNCMHTLSAAMHRNNINPPEVVISLPPKEWWQLYCCLESKFRSIMTFDDRGMSPREFSYMGFKFRQLVPE